MEINLTTQDARDLFKVRGLTYEDISEADIQQLLWMLNTRIKKAAKSGEMSTDIMHMSRKVSIKKRRNGTIVSAYLYLNSRYFIHRECISFNEDGFIGFCGWADSKNTKPIVETFFDWCNLFKDEQMKRSPNENVG